MKKWLVCLIVILFSLPAHDALTCAQLGIVAELTTDYRNQGYSLQQVLDEIAKLEKTDQLTADEIVILKQIATRSFTREITPYEAVKNCDEPK